jgi:Fur family ferric uptake transcriptional regulator
MAAVARTVLIYETITVLVIIRQMAWATDAEARLRQAGYRNGAARRSVIDYLGTQSCCRGAQEIHAAINTRGDKVGLASVYRVLDTLDEHGLVQRVDVGDGVVRYEPARSEGEHHHHLVCDDCGKVEQFADTKLERAIHDIEERSGYSVVTHDVVLRGACGDCRAA